MAFMRRSVCWRLPFSNGESNEYVAQASMCLDRSLWGRRTCMLSKQKSLWLPSALETALQFVASTVTLQSPTRSRSGSHQRLPPQEVDVHVCFCGLSAALGS